MADVTKQEVVLAVANVLLRLGRNDIEGTRRYLIKAMSKFQDWVETRPEKEALESGMPTIEEEAEHG